jgi:tetratricopeptide (TPR) repeat protein
MIAQSKCLLLIADLYLGNYTQARIEGEISLRLHQEFHDFGEVSYVLWNLGHIAIAEGAYAKAEQLLQESVTIHRELKRQTRLYDVLVSSGYAAWSLGNFFQARQYLSEALPMACKSHFLFTSVGAI